MELTYEDLKPGPGPCPAIYPVRSLELTYEDLKLIYRTTPCSSLDYRLELTYEDLKLIVSVSASKQPCCLELTYEDLKPGLRGGDGAAPGVVWSLPTRI